MAEEGAIVTGGARGLARSSAGSWRSGARAWSSPSSPAGPAARAARRAGARRSLAIGRRSGHWDSPWAAAQPAAYPEHARALVSS